jgi:hypothetical protein
MTERKVHDTHLCIGGPLDGKRVAASGTTMTVVVPPRELACHVFVRGEPTPVISERRVTYIKEGHYTPTSIFNYWAPEGQGPDETARLLFDSYARDR